MKVEIEIVKHESELYYRTIETLGVNFRKENDWKKVEEKDIGKELEEQNKE